MIIYSSKNSLRGAQNRAEGKIFEDYIDKACKFYIDDLTAFIEKTPEPFQVTRDMGNGRFAGHFKGQAQPDYKGTLRGGRAVVFDAKATTTDRIQISALSAEQQICLGIHKNLGAVAGVLCCWSFRDFAFIPYDMFIMAKELNGHKYWTASEAAIYTVPIEDGYIKFLKNYEGEIKCSTK